MKLTSKRNSNKKNHHLPIGHAHIPLKEFISYFQKSHVRNLEKSYILLSQKEVSETEKEIYITQKSLCENFHKVFGYHNESLARRLYLYLSKNSNKARISFENYMRRFFKLLYGSVLDKNKIAFTFYDYDHDGYISALDVYDLYRYYDQKGSKLHIEASMLVDDITQNVSHAKKSEQYFNYVYFSYMIKSSYITKEIGKDSYFYGL